MKKIFAHQGVFALFGREKLIAIIGFAAHLISNAGDTPMDADFLCRCLEKHKGKKIFICSHHICDKTISEECQRLLRKSGDVVFMYRGHTHINSVNDMGQSCANIKMMDIGGYGYSGQVVNGKYTLNVFDFAWAWGYQIIELYDDKVKTYHVKVKNRYVSDNGVFDVDDTVEGQTEYLLK